jgi:hypothetical protein
MIEEKEENCCGTSCGTGNSCCSNNNIKSSSTTLIIPETIATHEKICHILITKLLNSFKLHIKAYPFKVRKDIFRLINYVLKLIQFSQK